MRNVALLIGCILILGCSPIPVANDAPLANDAGTLYPSTELNVDFPELLTCESFPELAISARYTVLRAATLRSLELGCDSHGCDVYDSDNNACIRIVDVYSTAFDDDFVEAQCCLDEISVATCESFKVVIEGC